MDPAACEFIHLSSKCWHVWLMSLLFNWYNTFGFTESFDDDYQNMIYRSLIFMLNIQIICQHLG